MNKYDLMIIVDAHKAAAEKEEIYKQSTDAVTKAGAKVLSAQVWLEKQKFIFNIKKRTDGTYYLINFESAASYLVKLKELLRLNEGILRFLIVKI